MNQSMHEDDGQQPYRPDLTDRIFFWTLAGLLSWLMIELVLESQVESRMPAGHIRSVVLGGWAPKALIETETGFYPAYGVMRVERGAEVTLQLRRNGAWMICGPGEEQCVHTSDEAWQQTTTPTNHSK